MDFGFAVGSYVEAEAMDDSEGTITESKSSPEQEKKFEELVKNLMDRFFVDGGEEPLSLLDQLEILREKGKRNGVNDLEMLSGEDVRQMEPNVFAIAALFSPSSGVIDAHALMRFL